MNALLFALLLAQTPAATGVHAELIAQLDDAASKLQQLGEAIPQDKQAWRPAPGVRSVAEVLSHVTVANYLIVGFTGVKAPEGSPQAETPAADRAQAVAQLQRSFDHVRSAIRGMSNADLDKPATLFGQQTTNRGVLLLTVTHAHEHLGQLIAYARTNGVTPPWSMGNQ
ncbi:MAG: DinB family protein [Gemmatimonadales bacterium]|nr:DinB family protein [Gemmatimonadales bacterium]